MFNFKRWIPVTGPFPIKTFPQRLIRKWLYVVMNIVSNAGNLLGLLGARVIGISSNGNVILQLNKSYALGLKGAVLELPRDQVIFEFVKKRGSWELEESKFLSHGLKNACRQPHKKTALIDIGANTGLVTLQAMNLAGTNNDVFLFEPIPRHAAAIRQNLKNLTNIHVNEFALSDRNGEAPIFTEADNHGNSSLIKSVVPAANMAVTQIKLVDTMQYCSDSLNNFEKYVIKCDSQGMDALILSRLPKKIWENCESAVIEVWSLSDVSKRDVMILLSMFQEFDYVSWHPNARKAEKIGLDDVSKFWLSKTGAQKNLFLGKSI